ncbi:YXWGXW repeat-containing protein [Xenophilus sp. Marseille-Q4582]|uniref:YXWGXW repeat-containing protein n=1 Tax=Xenophilus sp. Marseille-Q4582 TaxID=2866600 RepID=UPI001CE48C65|nr:YXWGXW repeat-containing protein [Xenophilus sp. Marseille-Q4582]
MRTLSRITLSTAAAAVLSLGSFALPSVAQAQPVINVQIGQAPPPPRFERVPPPRRGYVWSPGHWEWQRGRHVWVAGTWLKARPGYAYRAPQWVQHDGRWDYRAGRWDRDRGHPGRGHAHGRDRDRDGVPNRYDARPNNPYRH